MINGSIITHEQVAQVMHLLTEIQMDSDDVYALANWSSDDSSYSKFLGLKKGQYVVSISQNDISNIQEFTDLNLALAEYNK